MSKESKQISDNIAHLVVLQSVRDSANELRAQGVSEEQIAKIFYDAAINAGYTEKEIKEWLDDTRTS